MHVNYKTFSGGYSFRRYEGQPIGELEFLPLPERVIVPLRQGFGVEAPPLVGRGDRVRAGRIIARDDARISSPIHATVSGVVREVRKINYFRREITAVEIESDGDPGFERLPGHRADWKSLEPEKIRELIYLSGVSSLDREGIPTGYRSSIIPPQEVKEIIVHGVGSEPYNLSIPTLLEGKNLFKLSDGLDILHRVMPSARLHLALNRRQTSLIEEMSTLLAGREWIDLYGLEPKYPQGYDEVLVPTILGMKFPYGYSAANIGVVILNIQAVIQAYEAVAQGKPLIERTVALCGTGFAETPHVRARVGAPLSSLVGRRRKEGQRLRYILNSPLTGESLSDLSLPINRTFSHVICLPEGEERVFLSFMRPGLRKDSYSRTFLGNFVPTEKECSTNVAGDRRPCIFCNFCQEVCPVNIVPHYLYHHVERGFIDEHLLGFGIFNCIECKLCTFVCPSKIPLAGYIKEGQEKLITMGCDRSSCILPYFDLKALEEYRGIK